MATDGNERLWTCPLALHAVSTSHGHSARRRSEFCGSPCEQAGDTAPPTSMQKARASWL
jgi:hypothetical protein